MITLNTNPVSPLAGSAVSISGIINNPIFQFISGSVNGLTFLSQPFSTTYSTGGTYPVSITIANSSFTGVSLSCPFTITIASEDGQCNTSTESSIYYSSVSGTAIL
jgi:hypothetical protein